MAATGRRDAAAGRCERMRSSLEPYLYAAPALILIVAVMLVPLALGLSYAFRDIQLLNPFSGGFVGLEHFRDALDGRRQFLTALRNTLWWTGRLGAAAIPASG